MKQRLYVVGLNLIAFWPQNHLQATVIARGNATSGPQTFTSKITAKVFDRVNHQLYVGLALSGSTGTNYALSYFDPANGTKIPQAFPWNSSQNTPYEFNKVAFLTMVGGEGERIPDIAIVPGTTTTIPDFTGKRVHVITFNGNLLPLTADIIDASGTLATNGIVALAASSRNIFTAVKTSGGNFGTGNSGIALINYINNFSAIQQSSITLLNNTTINLKIGATTPTLTADQVTLHWNDRLQRLYIGLEVTSGTNAGDGVRALIVGQVVGNGLVFENIAPDEAFFAGKNNIVGGIKDGSALKVGIKQIRSMHTSTGPNYLIVNGGVGAPGNTIFAFPLVNVGDPTNVTQGTVAKKDSFDVTTKQFTIQATANNNMPFIDTIISSSASDFFAVVGRGSLPMANEDMISDIVVVGDTVYVSLNTPNTFNDPIHDTGIWFSQALFDQKGVITDWTAWSKRSFPYDGFPAQSATDRGRIALFDVDAVNGKLWAINGGDLTTDLTRTMVATTSWDFGNDAGTETPTSLVGNINKALPDGCFSALDLDRATPDIGLFGQFGRYALFGGTNKVIFALVSIQQQTSQEVITNFSDPAIFHVTQLPADAGCVTTLAYSQQVDPDNLNNLVNYFFAGTQQGLFAFADGAGAGFPTISLNFVNQPPISTGIWQKISNIAGSIIALKASDDTLKGNLYILTRQATAQGFKSRLYSVPYKGTLATMFATTNIRLLAESGISATGSDLSGTLLFLGIENIYTRISRREQLVLATNAGVFTSHANEIAPNLGIIDATDQASAQWQKKSTNTQSFCPGVFGPKSPGKTTTWPIFRSVDECSILNRSTLHQLSGVAVDRENPSFAFNPVPFTSDTPAKFGSLPTTTHMWSDGARRIFAVKGPDKTGKDQLLIFPYNLLEWGIMGPDAFLAANPLLSFPTTSDAFRVHDPAFNVINSIYWLQHIGTTGILMAGTDRGIIALE